MMVVVVVIVVVVVVVVIVVVVVVVVVVVACLLPVHQPRARHQDPRRPGWRPEVPFGQKLALRIICK